MTRAASIMQRLYIAGLRVAFLLGHDLRLSRRIARLQGVRVHPTSRLHITSFGTEPWLIQIDAHAAVTGHVQLVTHDGSHKTARRFLYGDRDGPVTNRYGRIHIGQNAFIGTGAIILPGVSVGENSIVAAGSVVAKSVPAGVVAGGVPARVLTSVEAYAARVVNESLSLPDSFLSPAQKRAEVDAAVPTLPTAEHG